MIPHMDLALLLKLQFNKSAMETAITIIIMCMLIA